MIAHQCVIMSPNKVSSTIDTTAEMKDAATVVVTPPPCDSNTLHRLVLKSPTYKPKKSAAPDTMKEQALLDCFVVAVVSPDRNTPEQQQPQPQHHRTQRRRSSLLFTPGHDTLADRERQQERRRRRTNSLSFAPTESDQIKEIPRYDEETKRELFWGEAELNLMRCEAKMRKAGIDPDEFDWKSLR
jgi:hypothetical protein